MVLQGTSELSFCNLKLKLNWHRFVATSVCDKKQNKQNWVHTYDRKLKNQGWFDFV